MTPEKTKRTTTPVDIRRFLVPPGGLIELECPGCGAPMALHQPESEHPDRMLKTCGDCNSWYLFDLTPGESTVVMVTLPDHGHFLRAMEDDGPSQGEQS